MIGRLQEKKNHTKDAGSTQPPPKLVDLPREAYRDSDIPSILPSDISFSPYVAHTH